MPVYSVSSHNALLETVAAYVNDVGANNPLTLTQTLCILPTRRACRALERAFLTQSNTPTQFLPRILCLSDFGSKDLGLVHRHALSQDTVLFKLMTFLWEQNIVPHTTQAYHWAQSLLKLLDDAHLAQIDLHTSLERLLETEHALHRQGALEGLMALLETWKDTKPLFKSADHVTALEDLMVHWKKSPPPAPVITLGIHHSAPIYTSFLTQCARLPQGLVLLNDLDTTLEAIDFKTLPPSHPQWIHGRLLKELDLSPQDITPWPPLCTNDARRTLLAKAFQETFESTSKDETPRTLPHFSMIETKDRFEEATFASLLIRETLDNPDKKVLMVTPDRQLATLVTQMLRKWQIVPDDGAGTPLTHLTPFVFCQAILAAVAQDFSPITLLALLKHPYFAGGSATRALARTLEMDILRAPLAPQTLEACQKVCQANAPLWELLEKVRTACLPFITHLRQKNQSLRTLLEAHMSLALTLSHKDCLWEGEHAQQLETIWQDVLNASAHFPPLSPGSYPGIFPLLFKDQSVRIQHGIHPRVAVLSPQQAQLMKADRVIIAGLSEGLWPLMRAPSPWLSARMESALGLGDDSHTLAEAGRLFHEFCQGHEVILTRSLRLDGSPQTPARVWQRLCALLHSQKITLDQDLHEKLITWQEALHERKTCTPTPRPAPCPPRSTRPRQISVSALSLLQQDPYAFYVRYILELSPLDPIAPSPDARLFGVLLHACLEHFVGDKPFTQDKWKAVCDTHLAPVRAWGAIHLFWTHRMYALGPWLMDTLEELPKDTRFVTEERARLTLFPDLTLVAKADRIDISTATGCVTLIDYKTGALPTKADLCQGLALQLPLEAHMIAMGAFQNVPKDFEIKTAYWHLKPPFSVVSLEDTRHKALDHLQKLWAHYWQDEAPYHAALASHPQDFLPQEHMSRIQEWQHT